MDQLEPNRPIYNLPDTHYFKGPLDLDALERSLSEIVRRPLAPAAGGTYHEGGVVFASSSEPKFL